MSLSKIYSTTDTFEPEELVRSRFEEGSLVTRRLQPAETAPRQEKDEETPSPPQPAEEQGQEPIVATPPSITEEAAEPTPEPTEPTEPAEPPGVPPEEVERLVAESFENGKQAGHREAEADFGSAAASLLRLGQQLNEVRETILANSIAEFRDLAIAIAEKIVRYSIRNRDDTIVATVEEAIHKAVKSDAFTIYVNPQDYEVVAARTPELIAGFSGLENLVVKRDREMERGGCRVESDNCIVDASLLSQMEILGKAVREQQ